MPLKPDLYYSASLEEGLRILSIFTQNQAEFGLREISQAACIIKTSAYRFVNTLASQKGSPHEYVGAGNEGFHFGKRSLKRLRCDSDN
jgi:hypothetical protein